MEFRFAHTTPSILNQQDWILVIQVKGPLVWSWWFRVTGWWSCFWPSSDWKLPIGRVKTVKKHVKRPTRSFLIAFVESPVGHRRLVMCCQLVRGLVKKLMQRWLREEERKNQGAKKWERNSKLWTSLNSKSQSAHLYVLPERNLISLSGSVLKALFRKLLADEKPSGQMLAFRNTSPKTSEHHRWEAPARRPASKVGRNGIDWKR